MVTVLICGKTPSAGRKDIFEDLTLAVFSWKHMVSISPAQHERKPQVASLSFFSDLHLLMRPSR